MSFFRQYCKQRRKALAIFSLFCLVFFASFALYHLPLAAVLYPIVLCLILSGIFFLYDYFKMRKKHEELCRIRQTSALMIERFPEASGIEADYQMIIRALCEEQRRLETEMSARYTDMIDYYTVWAHQIKTPIASMHLTLQNEDSAAARELSGELFRIEQYVEMVLMFLRLDATSTDYVISDYDLDGILREVVKKFAGEFISRKIRLEYVPLQVSVLTDEKWLSFVISQVLSNALKYTKRGSVQIYMEPPKTLCIRDTGIGIAQEDLPRIFEKGYTGYNGRSDKKASGIGLYLCRRICKNLGHAITAESAFDRGTTIRIFLERKKLEVE